MSFLDKASDVITKFCGDIKFVIIHLIWWIIWIVFQAEPFPYGLLTLVVSLESIVLSTFILMSANRSEERDHKMVENDYKTDKQTLATVKKILKILEEK